jgi:hypothetical protein
VLESYEEHHVADVLCMELSAMAPDAEHFDAKATVLIESVSHHIEEEEQDWFPKVRAGLGRKQLQDIGAKLEQARRKAPRTPAQPSALKKTIDAVISLARPMCGYRSVSQHIRRRRLGSQRRLESGRRTAIAGAGTAGVAPPALGSRCRGLTARANLTSAPGVHHERVRQVEG